MVQSISLDHETFIKIQIGQGTGAELNVERWSEEKEIILCVSTQQLTENVCEMHAHKQIDCNQMMFCFSIWPQKGLFGETFD